MKTYQYHKPSESGLEKIKELRKQFSHMHDIIFGIVPQGREWSMALTKLEEAAMWAIKGVVIKDPESVVEE